MFISFFNSDAWRVADDDELLDDSVLDREEVKDIIVLDVKNVGILDLKLMHATEKFEDEPAE